MPLPPPPVPAPDAGNHPAPYAIYLELMGGGLLMSLNVERSLADVLALRLGVGLPIPVTSKEGTSTTITFPMTLSYTGLHTPGGIGLEIGGGSSLLYSNQGGASFFGAEAPSGGIMPIYVVTAGLRIHPVGRSGFQFRVGAMALFAQGFGQDTVPNGDPSRFGFAPWAYLSLGAAFR